MQTEHFRMLLLLVAIFASLSHGYGASMEQKELIGVYCSTQSTMNRRNKNCVISTPNSLFIRVISVHRSHSTKVQNGYVP